MTTHYSALRLIVCNRPAPQSHNTAEKTDLSSLRFTTIWIYATQQHQRVWNSLCSAVLQILTRKPLGAVVIVANRFVSTECRLQWT